MKDPTNNSAEYISLLSELLFPVEGVGYSDATVQFVTGLGRRNLGQLWELATTHHVILRAFPALRRLMVEVGKPEIEWIDAAMATEHKRVDRALSFLAPIQEAIAQVGHEVVIKSLDHAPDLGSDLDLYSTASADDVVAIMRDRFKARVAERSWGDRMANKWNFIVPGLPELVEVHIGRLGQMGEQVAITNSLVVRTMTEQFGSHTFRVPAAEDRLVISTLQRMYRHFYFRLCDIVDTSRLVRSVAMDYDYLETLTRAAGLWDGVCTYLLIISDYIESFGGQPLALPSEVLLTARFGGEKISVRRKFLRIPIFPDAAALFAKEWSHFLRSGELQNAMRLSLLPGLALTAALTLRITGSDKGIW